MTTESVPPSPDDSEHFIQAGIGVMKHQCLLLGLLLPNQIHHMVNGINCCVWLTYDTQKTSQLAWSGMIVCCQSYRGYFKHILCLIPFSPLSSVFDEFTEFDFSKSWLVSVFTLCQDKPDWTKISFIHSEIWTWPSISHVNLQFWINLLFWYFKHK